MCRSIKRLFNFDPPATEDEIRDASEQFVRKISGFSKPSSVNQAVFNRAVEEVATVSQELLNTLATYAKPRDRELEARRAHTKAVKRFEAAR